MYFALFLTILSITLFCGCGQPDKAPINSPAKTSKSTLSTVVDGATGRTSVKAGKKAKEQIESISEKHNNDLNEIMGE